METDDLYVGGSDDFRGYVWKIPPLAELLGERAIISARDWESKSRLGTIGMPISRLTRSVLTFIRIHTGAT